MKQEISYLKDNWPVQIGSKFERIKIHCSFFGNGFGSLGNKSFFKRKERKRQAIVTIKFPYKIPV